MGQWHCRGISSGALVLEGEGPTNQHDVEGGRWKGGGESVTKGRGMLVEGVGGGHRVIISETLSKNNVCILVVSNCSGS